MGRLCTHGHILGNHEKNHEHSTGRPRNSYVQKIPRSTHTHTHNAATPKNTKTKRKGPQVEVFLAHLTQITMVQRKQYTQTHTSTSYLHTPRTDRGHSVDKNSNLTTHMRRTVLITAGSPSHQDERTSHMVTFQPYGDVPP